MVFGFKNVVLQGSSPEVESVSEFIQELKSFAESLGWVTEDDRTSQAGSAVNADTHKIVFKSNGEAGGYPTFYMTVYSGTTAYAPSNVANFMMHTAYDVGTHDVPASGVATQTARSTTNGINIPSLADVECWMSGDSEAIVVVSRSAAVYDSMMIGRANSFTTTAENPFPLYVNANASNAIVTINSSMRLVSGEPPQAFLNNNEVHSLSILNTTNNQPYNLGAVTSIFAAAPLLITPDDASPTVRKGAIGTIRNAWNSTGTTAGMNQESRLTASGTEGEQIYRAFTINTTTSLVMRES